MTMTPAAPHPHDPWRDALGRFLHGNPGGPGNPRAREMAALRARFRAAVPEHTFRFIVEELLCKCMGGHLPAMKLFFAYYLGKPDAGIDADRLAHHELALAIEGARLCEAARKAGLVPPSPEPPALPPPGGRPEEEWRRPRRDRRGGAGLDEVLAALPAEVLRAVSERRSAPAQTVPDTPAPSARRRKGRGGAGVTAACH